ncbi:tetratricopeptide repeat protein [Streptomyces zaomyceticus]|uniref:tetratricopeptide repeat protein n=1 Tax=Streptomyces zaomyceticus TaxID=68286 RepID=UPI0037157B1D
MKWPYRKQVEQTQAPEPVQPAAGADAGGDRSIAIAGDNYGIAQTGDHATAVTLPPEALRPAAEVDAPPGLDNLHNRPYHFVGRTRELDRLDAALATPGGAVVQAVHGLGGIGKSALAAHWAATRAHGCAPVRWINADSEAAVQQGLADLATALQPALAHALPVEKLAERALQWLATHTGWLLVLDNVNDPADIASLTQGPATGRLLITSRLSTTWSHATTVVRLDVLSPEEALDLLTRITTAAGPRNLDGAAELCAELGHLPLAIEQAAAYLVENQLTTPTPRAYLDLLAQYPADMYREGAVGTAPERTIARVWRLTLDRITTLHPLAGDLLRTLAWYAPDRIPLMLLDDFAPAPARNKAIGLLTAYSVITPDPDTGSLTIHRLVQALARTPDPDDPHRTADAIDQARDRATTYLGTVLPADEGDPATWPTWRALLPHADSLADHTVEDTDTAATSVILNRAGLFLIDQGLPARAIRHLERALASGERTLGPDHPNTLASKNNVASAYWSAGDLGRALPLLEQALTTRMRVLGPNHVDTLTARSNLAAAYRSAGDLSRAIPLHEQTLTERMELLGSDHQDTLASQNHLAGAYESAGDLTRAISLHEQTLTARMRVLGPDHPETLASQNNLAGAYESAGDLDRAIPLYEQALVDSERVLGPDHPGTLTKRSNLAVAHGSAGDLDQAIPLHERTLTERLRVLGPDHPETLISRNNLAYAYGSAGDLAQAIRLYEQNLTERLRVLGPDHPDTLTSRSNLAYAYGSVGDLDRAIPLHEQALTDRLRVLGPEHPETLVSRAHLAGAHESAGDLDRAIPLYERALADSERVLGPDHPDTLVSRIQLGYAYESAGDLDRAIPLYERALVDSERVLGPDHPDTLASRANLADAYESAGDLARAIPLHERALGDSERVLGPDHPLTVLIRGDLAAHDGEGQSKQS